MTVPCPSYPCNEHCELPAFSTLDRMARRIRTLVNGGFYQRVLAQLSEAEQQALSALLQTTAETSFTPFTRIKEPPNSATLTHLDEWLSRLTWLQSLGNTQQWLSGIRSNKIIQFAEEAQSLPATDVADAAPEALCSAGLSHSPGTDLDPRPDRRDVHQTYEQTDGQSERGARTLARG